MERPALPKLTFKDDAKRGKTARIALLVVVALVSATFFRAHFSSAETYHDIYETIDQRQNNVLSLAFGTAIISSAISAMPDDMGTSLSSEYADFYTGFTIVIGALLLEKYLLTTLGFGFFAIVIPICCGLMISSMLAASHSSSRYRRRLMAKKLFVFGLTLFLITPTSTYISRQIDDAYSTSIEQTIKATDEVTRSIEQAQEKEGDKEEAEEDANPITMVQKQIDSASSAVSDAFGALGGFVQSILPWAINQLRTYAELVGVMIVTSIVIPLIVPLVIYFMFKVLFLSESDVTIPAPMVEALASAGAPLPSASRRQAGRLAGVSDGEASDKVQVTLSNGASTESDVVVSVNRDETPDEN